MHDPDLQNIAYFFASILIAGAFAVLGEMCWGGSKEQPE